MHPRFAIAVLFIALGAVLFAAPAGAQETDTITWDFTAGPQGWTGYSTGTAWGAGGWTSSGSNTRIQLALPSVYRVLGMSVTYSITTTSTGDGMGFSVGQNAGGTIGSPQATSPSGIPDTVGSHSRSATFDIEGDFLRVFSTNNAVTITSVSMTYEVTGCYVTLVGDDNGLNTITTQTTTQVTRLDNGTTAWARRIQFSYSNAAAISIDYDLNVLSGDPVFIKVDNQIVTQHDPRFGTVSLPINTSGTVTIDRGYSQNASAYDGQTLEITINASCGQRVLSRPLKASTQAFMTQPEYSSPFAQHYGVTHWATSRATVHAVADGTVTQIEPFNRELCDSLNGQIGQYASGRYPGANCLMPLNTDATDVDAVNIGEHLLGPLEGNTYLITIQSDDGYTYRQLVSDWIGFVSVGDSVSRGCVLGYTHFINGNNYLADIVSIFGTIGSIVSFAMGDTFAIPDTHLTMVWASNPLGENVDHFEWYSEAPSETAAPCNAGPEYEGCLSDARMQSHSDFSYNASATPYALGGFTLSSGGMVWQTMNLSPEFLPEMLVNVTVVTGSQHTVSLQLGQTLSGSVQATNNISIAAGAHQADLGGLYTVKVTNTSGGIIRLNYMCVRLTADSDGDEIIYGDEPPVDYEYPETDHGYIEENIDEDLYFYPDCVLIPELVAGASIGEAITWQWAHFNNFFECELMVALNRLLKTVRDSYRLMGWIQRYWMASYQLGIDWMAEQALPYLARSAGVAVTVNESDTCDNLFCLLASLLDLVQAVTAQLLDFFTNLLNILLNLLQPIIDLVVWLITEVWGLVVTLFELVIGVILLLLRLMVGIGSIAVGLLYTLLDAIINAEPVTFDALPDCRTDIHPVCEIHRVLEFTVFTGAGVYFIPLIVSGMSVHILLFAVKKSRRALRELGRGI